MALQGGQPSPAPLVDSREEVDCDTNGIIDVCEIANGDGGDVDFDGILDICQCDVHPQVCCPADLDGDGRVTGADLSLVLGGWGQSGTSADLDGDGVIGGADLALVLGAWGDC